MVAQGKLFCHKAALFKVFPKKRKHFWYGKALIKFAISTRNNLFKKKGEVAHLEAVVGFVYLYGAQLYLVLGHGFVKVEYIV